MYIRLLFCDIFSHSTEVKKQKYVSINFAEMHSRSKRTWCL